MFASPYLSGCCLWMRGWAVQAIGGLTAFLYFEDADITRRLAASPTVSLPITTVTHHWGRGSYRVAADPMTCTAPGSISASGACSGGNPRAGGGAGHLQRRTLPRRPTAHLWQQQRHLDRLLVLDDGSSDGTAAILRWHQRHPGWINSAVPATPGGHRSLWSPASRQQRL